MKRSADSFAADELRRAVEIHDSGHDWIATAQALGTSHATLRKALRAAGYRTGYRTDRADKKRPAADNANGNGGDVPRLLRRIRDAGRDALPDANLYCSEPRDLTGHPGHARLRKYWNVPPGGLGKRGDA
jgi:hypothetical protein